MPTAGPDPTPGCGFLSIRAPAAAAEAAVMIKTDRRLMGMSRELLRPYRSSSGTKKRAALMEIRLVTVCPITVCPITVIQRPVAESLSSPVDHCSQ